MTDNLNKAVEILKEKGCTCVICKEKMVFISFERGIKPLTEFYESDTDFRGCCAADKTVGKAAAMIYVLMEAKEVFAFAMSKGAVETFERFGVKYSYETMTDAVINREGTGICPMEAAVSDYIDPRVCYDAIKNRIDELSRRK